MSAEEGGRSKRLNRLALLKRLLDVIDAPPAQRNIIRSVVRTAGVEYALEIAVAWVRTHPGTMNR